MATKYIVKESTDLIGALEQNLKDSKQVFDTLKSATENLNESLSNGELKGKTYTSANKYFTEILLPMMENGERIVKEGLSDLEKYKYENSKIQHYGNIYVEKLTKERKIKQDQIEADRKAHKTLGVYAKDRPSIKRLLDEGKTAAGMASRDVKKIDEKLQALEDFELKTRNLFQYSMINLTVFGNAISDLKDVKITKEGEVSYPKSIFNNIEALKDRNFSNDMINWTNQHEDMEFANDIVKAGKKTIKATRKITTGCAVLVDRNRVSRITEYIEATKVKQSTIKGIRKYLSESYPFVKKIEKHNSLVKGTKKYLSEVSSFTKRTAKVAKGISIASTGIDTFTSYSKLKSRGYSDEQAILVSGRRTGVNLAISYAGGRIGGYIAMALLSFMPGGLAIAPFVYMAGEIIGSWTGDKVAEAINGEL